MSQNHPQLPSLIGLSGPARAGKDTCAQLLCARDGFTAFAYADMVRRALYTLDPEVGGESLRYLVADHGWEGLKADPRYAVPVRRLLQRLGTDVFRDMVGENVWVQMLLSRLDEHRQRSPVVVCDVRFANEAQALIDRGGIVLRVERPGHGGLDGAEAAHRSETDPVPHQGIVVNDGDLDTLYTRLREAALAATLPEHHTTTTDDTNPLRS